MLLKSFVFSRTVFRVILNDSEGSHISGKRASSLGSERQFLLITTVQDGLLSGKMEMQNIQKENSTSGSRTKIITALLSVYMAWSSTYLAIRIALESFPPFFMAGIRFLLVGCGLYLYLRSKGVKNPTRPEWAGGSLIGALLLLGGNGAVVYAEQWVASGLTALALATTPLWTVLFAGIWKRWPTKREWAGLSVGLAGVILLNLEGNLRASPVGAIALVVATLCWGLGSAWSRHVPLPPGLMAGAVEMISGGALLLLASGFTRESITATPTWRSLSALIYLAVFGSLIGFSAYVYLLSRVRPALATSNAYVNPVIAVALGVWLAGEQITAVGIIAMGIILAGVVIVAFGEK